MTEQHWTAYGSCSGASPDDLFVEGAAQRSAREVCADCPVRLDCLIDALDNRIAFGVWGGMTERERRSLLRRHPDIESWREIIEADQDVLIPSIYRNGRPVRALEREPVAGG